MIHLLVKQYFYFTLQDLQQAAIMIWKVIFGLLALVFGVMYQTEVDEDILLIQKGVAISATRAKVFMYISDMRNQKKVWIFKYC